MDRATLPQRLRPEAGRLMATNTPRTMIVEIVIHDTTSSWQSLTDECGRMVHDRFHGKAEVLNVYPYEPAPEADGD